MKVRIHPEAAAEIELARRYLDAQRPGLGGRFLEEVSQAFSAICDRPLSFAKLETLPQDAPYRRVRLGTLRYVVVFECVEDGVDIIAVSHGSRAPNYWLGRETPES